MTATLERLQSIPSVSPSEAATGYLHPDYAKSLSEFGQPRPLQRCGGWVLQRPIGKTGHCDAIGCYPLFCCRDWRLLGSDLNELVGQLVSVSMVIDPFADITETQLRDSFDLVKRYKEHWCVDLRSLDGEVGNKHHRYYARKALRQIDVEARTQPAQFAAEWSAMYANLVQRHAIRGIQAFSPRAFAAQLNVSGMIMFRATQGSVAVAAHLWYVQGEVAYSHLAASTDLGYAANASYALYYRAISAFKDGIAPSVRHVHLGAGAGIAEKNDGLTLFKKGWANCSRPAYFCGRILDRETYEDLGANAGCADFSYFPAYRKGEMT